MCCVGGKERGGIEVCGRREERRWMGRWRHVLCGRGGWDRDRGVWEEGGEVDGEVEVCVVWEGRRWVGGTGRCVGGEEVEACVV